MNEFNSLKLENQLCFPLYACAKEIVRKYTPFLEELNLTYTQYIVMLVLWEHKKLSVKKLGQYVYLDSGTLTPLLKKLESLALIQRARDSNDERMVIITLTEGGIKLRKKAQLIPEKLGQCLNISPDEAKTLYTLLYKLLADSKIS